MFSADGNISLGWRHYWKETFVRGCVGENGRECVQFLVNTALTTNTSITCEWTLADDEGTIFMADQDSHHFQLLLITVQNRLKMRSSYILAINLILLAKFHYLFLFFSNE